MYRDRSPAPAWPPGVGTCCFARQHQRRESLLVTVPSLKLVSNLGTKRGKAIGVACPPAPRLVQATKFGFLGKGPHTEMFAVSPRSAAEQRSPRAARIVRLTSRCAVSERRAHIAESARASPGARAPWSDLGPRGPGCCGRSVVYPGPRTGERAGLLTLSSCRFPHAAHPPVPGPRRRLQHGRLRLGRPPGCQHAHLRPGCRQLVHRRLHVSPPRPCSVALRQRHCRLCVVRAVLKCMHCADDAPTRLASPQDRRPGCQGPGRQGGRDRHRLNCGWCALTRPHPSFPGLSSFLIRKDKQLCR